MSIQLNGTPISASLLYVQSTYTSKGWSENTWLFSESETPVPKPDVRPDYPITGIDYAPINAILLVMNGVTAPLSDFFGSTKYTPLGWATTNWTFNDLDFPSVNPPTIPTYPVIAPPIDMTPWMLNETRMNGTPISYAKSRLAQTYTGASWSTSTWTLIDNSAPEPKPDTVPSYPNNPIDFYPWSRNHNTINGGIISSPNHLKVSTYTPRGWNFNTVWGINEDIETPTLLQYKRLTPVGDHRSSSAWEVLLDPASIGSVYLNNSIYDPKQNPNRFSIKGTFVGDTVEHKMQRQALLDENEKTYVFAVSAIEDTSSPSGYGSFTPDTSRTVTIKDNASSDVAFLYTRVDNPSYDYLLKVATSTDMIYHIVLLKSDASEMRLKVADGSVTTVPLVDVNDMFASPIRVKTDRGIFALQSILPNEDALDYTTEIDTKLKVLYVTRDVNTTDTRDICNTIRELGHTVIIMADTYIQTKEINSFKMYDMAIVGRTTDSSYATKISLAGVPVILGYMTENAIGLQTELAFTDKTYYSPNQHPIGQQVLNNTHPITKDLPATFDAYKNVTNEFISVLDSTGNVVGEPLIKSTGHSLTTNYTMTAHTTSIGTRYVFMGFLYRNVSDTTKILLDRAIKWVAKKDHLL